MLQTRVLFFLYNHPCEVSCFNKYALIIGDNVNAQNAEIKTDPDTT